MGLSAKWKCIVPCSKITKSRALNQTQGPSKHGALWDPGCTPMKLGEQERFDLGLTRKLTFFPINHADDFFFFLHTEWGRCQMLMSNSNFLCQLKTELQVRSSSCDVCLSSVQWIFGNYIWSSRKVTALPRPSTAMFGCPKAHGTWSSPGQGSDLGNSCNPRHSGSNDRSSTHCEAQGSSLSPRAPKTPGIPLRHSGNSWKGKFWPKTW